MMTAAISKTPIKDNSMSEPNYDEIRSRVEQRFNKQKEILIHGVTYLIINGLVWILYLTGALYSFPVFGSIVERFGVMFPLVVSLGWGVGMIAHALDYYYSVGGGARRRERAIQQAIEDEVSLRREFEKPKRDPRVHLTEDGELEEIDDDMDYEAEPKRRRR
jgi:hypothetical protein